MLNRAARQSDVIVAGAGPAGLALAAELADRGMTTSVVAPDLDREWQKSFGCFEASLAGGGWEAAVQSRHLAPRVTTQQGVIELVEPYLRFSTLRLQRVLRQRALQRGVQLIRGTVESEDIPTTGALIVDATGTGSLSREAGKVEADCYQTAYGQWLELPAGSVDPGEMWLMDYSAVGETEEDSFLYALHEGPGEVGARVFVQETVLASRAPVRMSELKRRLQTRLLQRGWTPLRVVDEELCLIPMGRSLPTRRVQCLPFGAAAGFVHPATGYQLSRAFNLAAPVAEAISLNLDWGQQEAIDMGLEVMWPSARRQAWGLYRWGASVLVSLTPAQQRQFTQAFFALPPEQWRGFMEGSLSSPEILRLMWAVFENAPLSLRLKLLTGSSLSGGHALRSAFA